MVFVFGSVYVMNYVYRFAYVEQGLHPQDEAYLVMMDKLFDVLLHLVCQYFIEDFFEISSPSVSARFCYQDDVGLIK